jgi:hypothetical protein
MVAQLRESAVTAESAGVVLGVAVVIAKPRSVFVLFLTTFSQSGLGIYRD